MVVEANSLSVKIWKVVQTQLQWVSVAKGSEVGLLVKSDKYENSFSLIGRYAGHTGL